MQFYVKSSYMPIILQTMHYVKPCHTLVDITIIQLLLNFDVTV
jgi:hypothetical protein